MNDKFVKFISTFFYTGYFPMAPGTFGSAAAALMSFVFSESLPVYCTVFVVITVLGFATSGRMEKLLGKEDPGCVVIDEASGIMISFFLLPWTPEVIFTAFFVFRAVDMFKIYPANEWEKKHGGTGIMMDDIIAGIYTNITMHIAIRLAGII